MATRTETPKNEKKVGNYSEPGIHSGDEKNAAGQKKPFDRGDPGEDKVDLIQGEPKDKGKHNAEIPQEYAEPGFNENVPNDDAGHKLKFDRGAPEENPEALHKSEPAKPYSEDTEVSEPNYVSKEHEREKQASKNAIAGLSEREFLENLIIKASAGGWDSPVITEIRHRLETIK